MERRVLPGDGVLGIGPMRGAHLVEGGDAVAGLELCNIDADLVDDAGDIVALVILVVQPEGGLPVLGVRPAHDDLDEHLVVVGLRDRHVLHPDFGTCKRGDG